MAKWLVAAKKADFNDIGKEFHISPIIARIIRNRDLLEKEDIRKFLYGTIEEQYDPFLLKNMKQATEIIIEKIREHKKIRIIGDYDADGICSTYILKKGLISLGGDVDAVIPHRQKDGYGLNIDLIDSAAKDGIDMIVTCDNGISATQQIKHANELKMTVVITDHHEVPFEENANEKKYCIPEAAAVIDPKQPSDTYPFSGICGTVVAYKLLKALGVSNELLTEFEEFTAFATICDVMELLDENRILVKHGLSLMKNSKNQGLKALIEVNKIEPSKLTAYHIGFVLGPCMNATGRLDTAKKALELLESSNHTEAVKLAWELKNMNEERKEMTEAALKLAVDEVEEKYIGDKVLVVYLPSCHESLAGIVAGRIRERYGKPTFVLTDAVDGVKGSGRSIENYDMYAEMCGCKELFTKYGGHKMAAGLSLEAENVSVFRSKINGLCSLKEEDFEEKVHIDVPMPLEFATEELVEQLRILEPFGTGNQKPVFAQKNITLVSGQLLGANKSVGKYRIRDEQQKEYTMVYFGNLDKFHEFIEYNYKVDFHDIYQSGRMELPMDITYYPTLNEFGGRRKIEVIMTNYTKRP